MSKRSEKISCDKVLQRLIISSIQTEICGPIPEKTQLREEQKRTNKDEHDPQEDFRCRVVRYFFYS